MGVALANGGNEPAEVSYELVRLDGVSSGVSGKLIIPANGQKVSFVRELAGAEELAVPFKGVLRLSSSTPIAALAIRGRYNTGLQRIPSGDADAGWSSLVAREAHNLEVAGSNPVPAT